MITAKVICDSISNNIRLTTLELYYPRFIHSQFMTHRMFSRNASSSRAIPISKIIKEVEDNPAMPIHWGKNQPGMQADEELDNEKGKLIWLSNRNRTVDYAKQFNKAGYHKQIVNRLLEPFSHIKVIVTATEWEGFFKLRLDHDSQPEIQELAMVMKEAMDNSTPRELEPGEWHLPYINRGEDIPFKCRSDRIKASVARCARVSYNNHDNSSPDIKKDIELADKLIAASHLSPLEHQATPMKYSKIRMWMGITEENWEEGVTHADRYKNYWSGNFKGFIQYRQLIS